MFFLYKVLYIKIGGWIRPVDNCINPKKRFYFMRLAAFLDVQEVCLEKRPGLNNISHVCRKGGLFISGPHPVHNPCSL